MKNFVVSFVLIISSLSMIAQPQIVDASNLPDPGFSFSFGMAPNSDPGSSGANQIWDFSELEYSEIAEGVVIDASESPFIGSYPTADFAYTLESNFTAYTHLNVTETKMEVITYVVTTPGNGNDYSPNPRTMLKFPFDFQEEVNDTWQKSGESEQTVLLEYDGYGTIKTPVGTYNNVVRIRENYGVGEDDYQWYTLNPLMQVAVFDHNDNMMYFFGAEVTSIDETIPDIAVEVFPNPAKEYANVTISGSNSVDADFVLFNIMGQPVNNFKINESSYRIDLRGLSDGLYFYQFTLDNGKVHTGTIVVK